MIKPTLKDIWSDDDDIRWRLFEEYPYPFPSVTSVLGIAVSKSLKSFWINNTKATIDSILKCTSERGTVFHDKLEHYLDGSDTNCDASYKHLDLLHMTLDEVKRIGAETVANEITLVHPDYGLCGMADYLCKVKGKLEIWDWKTGNVHQETVDREGKITYEIKPNIMMQLALYVLMARLQGYDVETFRVVWCSIKNKKVKSYRAAHVDFWIDKALMAFETWKAFHFKKLTTVGIPRRKRIYTWPTNMVLTNTLLHNYNSREVFKS